MVDEPSSLGEAVMLGAGSIDHRELIYYTVSKSTTFHPPRSGPGQARKRIWGGEAQNAISFVFFAPLEELGGSKYQANNSTSICEKVGFLMLCLDPLS